MKVTIKESDPYIDLVLRFEELDTFFDKKTNLFNFYVRR